MPRFFALLLVAIVSLSFVQTSVAQIRKANELPWELKFDYSKPARIVVRGDKDTAPQAYWYLPYKVTNTSKQELMFLPVFELVAEDGKIRRSDKNVHQDVIDAIKKQEGNKFIQSSIQISGELRLGPEEAKYGVAIWPEPSLRVGSFAILVGGLSGEYQQTKNPAGQDVVLRKTLQLNFIVRGDEVYPGEDEINENASLWIMR